MLRPVYSTSIEPPYNCHYKCDECGVVCIQFTMCDNGHPSQYLLLCNGCIEGRCIILPWVDVISIKFRLYNSWFYQIGLTNIAKEISDRYAAGNDDVGQYILVQLLLRLKRYRKI